jgi:hypothetical protein
MIGVTKSWSIFLISNIAILPLVSRMLEMSQYGNGAIRASLAGLTYVIRGKDYQLLDRKARSGTFTPACRSAVQPP